MDEELDDEQLVRKCSIDSLSKIFKRFQPEDFDKIYIQALKVYNKHYAPYSKPKNVKAAWNKQT